MNRVSLAEGTNLSLSEHDISFVMIHKILSQLASLPGLLFTWSSVFSICVPNPTLDPISLLRSFTLLAAELFLDSYSTNERLGS
jgi:hypothetical protein